MKFEIDRMLVAGLVLLALLTGFLFYDNVAPADVVELVRHECARLVGEAPQDCEVSSSRR